MRHHDVAGIAARAKNAEIARRRAEMLVAAPAGRAGAAAVPGIDQAALARLKPDGVGSGRHHFADRLVAERDRRGEAALGEAEALASAEIVIAVPDMHVGVADPGGQHAQQHLGAGRNRIRALCGGKLLAEGDHIDASHRVTPRPRCSSDGPQHRRSASSHL
jgi:hypothetical protein